MWWRANFGRDETIAKVRVKNRVNCCGARLGATDIFIGTQKCGQIPMGTKNGQWYTVTCPKQTTGNKVELKTTRNEYLSISGIEVWTGVWSWSSSTTTTTTTTTTTSTSRPMPMGFKMGGFKTMSRSMSLPMGFKMGGFKMGGFRTKPLQLTFSHTGNKVAFENMTQGPRYSNDRFPASNVLSGGSKFTHTTAKAGAYWKADFQGGEKWIW